MKKIKVYKRDYKKDDEYYELKKYIQDNFIPDEKDSGNYEQKYIGLEENVFVRLSLKFNKFDMDSVYKSEITIEKIGPNADKESEIETLLLNKGFK
jgi:hypothetical protein